MSKRQFVCVYRMFPTGNIVSEGLGEHTFTQEALNEVCKRGKVPSIGHFHHLEVYEVMPTHLVGTYLSETVAKYRDMAESHAARIRAGATKPAVKLTSGQENTPAQSARAEMEAAVQEILDDKKKMQERFANTIIVPTYVVKVAT